MPKKYWYVILTYVLMQLSSYVVAGILRLFTIDDATFFTVAISWNIISFVGALIIILYLLRQDMKKTPLRDSSTVSGIIGWSILGVFLAIAAQIVSTLIETFVLGIEPGSENTQNIMNIARAAPIFIVIVSIIAPILEEIIFRKIIFGTIYERTNFILAALSSALIFAFVHNDITHLLTYTAMGFVFAFLYVQTKRIIVPILAHMAMNTMVVIAQLSVDPEDVDKMVEDLNQLQVIIGGYF
ncbi:CPBP family intramembrane glutamic endopeptidase [Aquibacillus rhizosphaerae]|uniref:Type II CAAX endopeptidase family protein n=1 Tax=Aquibacillus rhizosphaerae TaxID=3051431 RepID=A0ABT7L9U2_9BACI|nr:type II CAAX endopeptidase family protein [Aquibacillus sp. LR5S19]MDL4841955.1 type II CAAX endopeptidase family protein [Aquibacillus sp. LR5S19]